MTLEELQEKYKSVPEELKVLKRWVCYKIEERNGQKTKVPVNALSGTYARCNDEITWSKFSIAITGCVKYNCLGLGFMLGDGIFGIDLDNHPDKDGVCLSKEEFDVLGNEFVEQLDSYTELSQSGLGIHIICKGTLPKGRRRKGNVEMYDSGRFFAFTGNAIRNIPINERTEEIIPLWEKYVDDSKEIQQFQPQQNNGLSKYNFLNYDPEYKTEIKLGDQELINKALLSKQGYDFNRLYQGDLSGHGNDHSAADMAFCSMLAFWCNSDKAQMDRIFRSSGLMRPKWDERRGADTYGNITLDNAIRRATNGFVNLVNNTPTYTCYTSNTPATKSESQPEDIIEDFMNIDNDGEPIFRIKKIFHRYPLTDTGNALRFYDYFGELFRYNKTDKIFMFWTGKTWIRDTKDIIRKYANKLIDILKDEEKELKEEKESLIQQGEADKADELTEIIKASQKNTSRVANKAGKDAMLSEFQSIKNVAVENKDLDKDGHLLNTDSGIVNLKTGEIMPYDPKYMMSLNTNTKVSFEEPKEWIKFLHSIFRRENVEDELQIIDCIQKCGGYSLTDEITEQCMFLQYGGGSNGKSTFSEQLSRIMGDYGASTPSSTLIQQKNGMNASVTYSLAKLKGKRYVEVGETDEGEKLAEAQIKRMTGGDTISAAFKYGNEFDFKFKGKIWMSTNNKPVIRGTDLGIWRRMFPFPYLNTFTDAQKDRSLPSKLAKEDAQILGWFIQGAVKYYEAGKIDMPECLKAEVDKYKGQMDIISQFIKKQCVIIENYKTPCRALYQNYKIWAKDSTEYIMRESKFDEEIKLKGIKQTLHNGEPHFVGIKLNCDKTTAYVFNPFDE